MDVVLTDALSKRYGSFRALDQVSLRVPAGCIFGFLGPNGAGKSTTIRILMGLMKSTSGRATVFGLDCWRDSLAIRGRVGYLPGDIRFYDGMTGRETLAFLAGARGMTDRSEIQRLSVVFGLDLRKRVRQYSKGMKQKLGLIQAMMHRPDLLILDEPTSSLDPLVQQTLYGELRAAAARGTSVLFSSHTLFEVEALCEHIAIVRHGKLVEQDRLTHLRARATRRVEFTLLDGIFPTPPSGFELRRREDRVVSGAWSGPIQPMLAFLAQAPIADVTIGPPDLEDLFLSYYEIDVTRGAGSN